MTSFLRTRKGRYTKPEDPTRPPNKYDLFVQQQTDIDDNKETLQISESIEKYILDTPQTNEPEKTVKVTVKRPHSSTLRKMNNKN